MSTPRITRYADHLLFELPPQAMNPRDFQHWMEKINALCREHRLERVLIWRKDPTRLHISQEDITRTIHVMDCLELKKVKIALAFPADYYNEMLDQFTLHAKRRGINAELFFDVEMARSWLLDN